MLFSILLRFGLLHSRLHNLTHTYTDSAKNSSMHEYFAHMPL
jgi:hypothetical protein